MAKVIENNRFKRTGNRYRIVVSNDDSFEELITFKVSRLGVFSSISIIFVILICFIVSVMVFTPLKYYIPGYGSRSNRVAMQKLKIRADSLDLALKQNQQYLSGLQKMMGADSVTDHKAATVPSKKLSYERIKK